MKNRDASNHRHPSSDDRTAMDRRAFVKVIGGGLVLASLPFSALARGSGLVTAPGAGATAEDHDLAARWRFQLDRADAGMGERWFARTLAGEMTLPASLPSQGVGDPISVDTPWMGKIEDQSWFTAPEYARYREPGHVKVPFWLQPGSYYSGVTWFQRTVDIPAEWAGRRVVLSLERPHWETRAWLDERPLGSCMSLSTPHEYDLGDAAPGTHVLTIRVDNRLIIDIGTDSHAICDHTQGNWNGIAGRIELRATPKVWLEDVQVYPHLATKTATVRVRVGNATGKAGRGVLSLGCAGSRRDAAVAWDKSGGEVETEIRLGADARPWDEFTPELQTLVVTLDGGESREVRFGLREISTEGTQFLVNGRKTFMRGTLECCIFPDTGHPPVEPGEWRRVFGVAKAYGLNLIRFHSYCPPKAAFEVADEIGLYLQVETCWANRSVSLGDGHPVDQWIYDETDRILNHYGNHPSFVLMPYGNEPGGRKSAAYLARYVIHFRARDSRRLWSGGSGWPELPENQFFVALGPRVQHWGAGKRSKINGKPPETMGDYRTFVAQRPVPVISHEVGQWCVYPDFDEIPEYTGYLKPRNFKIFRDQLEANGLGHLARDFLRASGRLQVLCYKDDIEALLRTPGMGGFELLDVHDFPGQGTALVGVLNPFWREKGYVTSPEYRRFCSELVPLARLPKRVFTRDETFTADIEVSNFGANPVPDVAVPWRLVADDGSIVASGTLPARSLPVDNGIALGGIQASLAGVRSPSRLRFVVSIPGTTAENDWNVWVYPGGPDDGAEGVHLTNTFDEAARETLEKGGRVLLTLPAERVRNEGPAPVKLGFSSIFWNTAWTKRQAPTTLGILCDPKHPALAEFPTEFCSDWQWWYLISRAGALRLDTLPRGIEPLVRVIDDWVTARSLGLVVEARVGAGRLVVCGFDLTGDHPDPVSRQMRRSLLAYMAGDAFRPTAELTPAQIESLIA